MSHAGIVTQLGADTRMAQMMRPQFIHQEQVTLVAEKGGVWGLDAPAFRPGQKQVQIGERNNMA